MSTQSDTAPAPNPAAVSSGATQGTTTVAPGPLSAAEIHAMQERAHVAGVEQGEKQAMTRFKAIIDACPGKPQMAVNAFIGGQTADAVKLAFEYAAAAEANADARIAQIQEENKRAVAMAAIGGYSGGVPMGIDATDDDTDGPMTPEAAKEAAAREWDRNPAVRKNRAGKESYVAVRAAELRGAFKGRVAAASA